MIQRLSPRRTGLLCGAILALANIALADGKYQPTRDGRTFVWNNYPRAGDQATWTGGRDRDGYARGFGTLTWYILDKDAFAQPTIYGRYWGKMERGKLNGAVNVHAKNQTRHAIFVNGVQRTRWSPGTARSLIAFNSPRPRLPNEANHSFIAGTTPPPASTRRNATVEPPVPAEGPPQKIEAAKMRDESIVPRSEATGQSSETGGPRPVRALSEEERASNEPPKIIGSGPQVRSFNEQTSAIPNWPKIDVDRSIQILAVPPRTLNLRR